MKKNLRTEAKGRECQIRCPNICNGNSETVVLAHLNNKSVVGGGMGKKPHDLFGAWACSDCHALVDGRTAGPIKGTEWEVMFHEGVFRTQKILLDEGKI